MSGRSGLGGAVHVQGNRAFAGVPIVFGLVNTSGITFSVPCRSRRRLWALSCPRQVWRSMLLVRAVSSLSGGCIDDDPVSEHK